MIDNIKTCKRCNLSQSKDQFYKDVQKSDKLSSYCKECIKIKQAEYYLRKRDSIITRTTKYYTKNKQNIAMRARIYRDRNKDKIASRRKEYREKNLMKVRESVRLAEAKSRQNDPIKHRRKNKLAKSKRRAMLAQNGGSHTWTEWERLVVLCKSQCCKCGLAGTADSLTRDHVIPISKGGSDSILNIQPLCWPCNNSKNAHNSDDFRDSAVLNFFHER
jgi:5-methylcytosine-specific restriction endonuclease McrA